MSDFPDPVYDVTCSCGRKWGPVRMADAFTVRTAHYILAGERDHTVTSLAFADAARLREMRASRRPAATVSVDQPPASVPGWAERHSGSQGGER